MVDVLYGEADAEVRVRVDRHLAECAAYQKKMAALRTLQQNLAA
jgi:anti-sigma factor RsiW